VTVLRPLCFVVVVWGERFRRYLTDYCLPSLLSPGNIPALAGGRGNRFLICTTPADRAAIRETPAFIALERHITPVFVEIPLPPAGRSGCEHMGVGHRAAAELVRRDGGYGVFLTPDLMLSDGSVAALERHARNGRRVVLCAAFRFGEEPLFEQLRAMGALLPSGAAPAAAVMVTGRQLVSAMLRSFHSEGLSYGWDAPAFANLPAACWWRVPGEDGIVVHSLSWAPLLLDYAAVARHDTTALETWTIDADYVYRNFGDTPDIHIVTDSDEIMLVSWTPLAETARTQSTTLPERLPLARNWIKGAIVRGALTSGIFDPLKQRSFFIPVRWHAGDLTPAWTETERRAAAILRRYAGDPAPESHGPARGAGLVALAAAGRLWIVAADVFGHTDRLRLRVAQALRGDREAVDRLRSRAGRAWKTIRGSPAAGH